MSFLIPCLYCFVACLGFCFIFNTPKRLILQTSLGGALGWAVFLLNTTVMGEIFAYFFATVVISIYAEIMARISRVPVTLYLIIALLPLVPGGRMYYTMEHCINGEMLEFVEQGMYTLSIAGSLAMGILVVTSIMRLWKMMKYPEAFHKEKWDQ